MTETTTRPATASTGQKRPPIRLHHNAFLTKDQEATRRFYEELVGMPLVATWCEVDELFGAGRVYCHTFFAMADGSALAFFQFADPADQAEFDPELTPSPFRHIALATDRATQDGIRERLAAGGYTAPDTYVLDHGYCVSLYVTDPNGLLLEFTVDDARSPEINETRLAGAHEDLRRWLAGDHSSNNTYR